MKPIKINHLDKNKNSEKLKFHIINFQKIKRTK